MPIKIPYDLPARPVLEKEGVEIIDSDAALRQDIRPLRFLLLNLMPKKVQTEIQLARLLSHTPLQVDLTLLTTSTYTPTNINPSHLKTFYKTHQEIVNEKFDGLVITGAPVERMEFEAVDYWAELCEIFEWSRSNVTRSLNICWGAQAALYHEFGIPKYELPHKAFGVFEQNVVAQGTRTLLGFPDRFPMPVSRHTETRRSDVEPHKKLTILIESEVSGVAVIEHGERGDLYIFNHFEYDLDTLRPGGVEHRVHPLPVPGRHIGHGPAGSDLFHVGQRVESGAPGLEHRLQPLDDGPTTALGGRAAQDRSGGDRLQGGLVDAARDIARKAGHARSEEVDGAVVDHPSHRTGEGYEGHRSRRVVREVPDRREEVLLRPHPRGRQVVLEPPLKPLG